MNSLTRQLFNNASPHLLANRSLCCLAQDANMGLTQIIDTRKLKAHFAPIMQIECGKLYV